MKLSGKQKAAFGIGAVGKDMVYALSANYIMYYYQDVLGLSASFVGLILMIARVFDAVNDPFMGILVAKTRTRWGRFRPWIFSGSIINAFVLYALFSAPDLGKTGLMVFFSIVYILWGMTYTMMDIPYWSMIPAVTSTPEDTEQLSVVGRTCAGVGSALIAMGTVLSVAYLGGGSEKQGFSRVALIVAVIFVAAELVCVLFMRERTEVSMETSTVKDMFRALFANDQALTVVLTLVFINTALYVTSNLIIYYCKYALDLGADWQGTYTLYTTVGGGCQILGMMVVYPLLRKKLTNTKIFMTAISSAIAGYAIMCILFIGRFSATAMLLYIPVVLVFAANGMLSVLTTVFLSNAVDYGELKTGTREESVIFSMQTFVVKASAGISAFLVGIGLDVVGIQEAENDAEIAVQSAASLNGLRILLAVPPMLLLIVAMIIFRRHFRLQDDVVAENYRKLREGKEKDCLSE